jgi:uncharacterized RDD family membrane protein YckC
MRCPTCGFVTFDHLPACKRCGVELPHPGTLPASFATAGNAIPSPPLLEGTVALAGLPAGKEVSVLAPLEMPGGVEVRVDAESLPKAGFWVRSVAFLMDMVVVAALATAGGILVWMAVRIGGTFSSAPEVGLEWLEAKATAVLTSLIGLCYFTLFVGWRGQTPGKMLLGLRIIRVTGEGVGYTRALVRWIGQGLGFLLFGIGFLMIAYSRRKQGLHDKLVGTYVVRIPS